MAKSITLNSTTSFKSTDNGLNKILFDFQKNFTNTINSESVQYGEVTLFTTELITLNLVSPGAGYFLYVENVEDEDDSQVTVVYGSTAFSTLKQGEFLFVKLRTGDDIKLRLNTDLGQATCKYFLIEF
ncbi:hypothetical protein N9152_00920 [bacterium]|nr:hypothetical protein [bacterium]